MPVIIDYDYSEVAHLQSFFDDLKDMDQRKIFLQAFRKATKPLVQELKRTVPQGKTKNLLRSIGTMQVPRDIAILVGTKKGGGMKGWHGHLVENGTYERFRQTKDGRSVSTGRMPASHFFEESYRGREEDIAEETQKEFYIAIDNLIVKVNKKLDMQ